MISYSSVLVWVLKGDSARVENVQVESVDFLRCRQTRFG